MTILKLRSHTVLRVALRGLPHRKCANIREFCRVCGSAQSGSPKSRNPGLTEEMLKCYSNAESRAPSIPEHHRNLWSTLQNPQQRVTVLLPASFPAKALAIKQRTHMNINLFAVQTPACKHCSRTLAAATSFKSAANMQQRLSVSTETLWRADSVPGSSGLISPPFAGIFKRPANAQEIARRCQKVIAGEHLRSGRVIISRRCEHLAEAF